MSDKWGAGEPDKWRIFSNVKVGKKEYPLLFGEHPHSRQDNNMYVLDDDDEPIAFDGNRHLINISFVSKNYIKESELSGSEIRKSGSVIIQSDGIQIYELFYRDIQHALREVDNLLTQIYEHPSNWLDKQEREKLVGHKVYYREIPAIIEHLVTDQGALILRHALENTPFPVDIYDYDTNHYNDNEYVTVKVDVLDPKIWWFREKLVEGEV